MEKPPNIVSKEINSNVRSNSSIKGNKNNNKSSDINIPKSTQIPKKRVKYDSINILKELRKEPPEKPVSEEEIKEAIKLYRKYFKDKSLEPDLDKVNGRRILLKDIELKCPICEEEHCKDSQYLLVENGGRVILECIQRDNDKKAIILNKTIKSPPSSNKPSDNPYYELMYKVLMKPKLRSFPCFLRIYALLPIIRLFGLLIKLIYGRKYQKMLYQK
jgi:hypothetical protein